MNDLQIFSNPEFGNIRTVTIDGNPWFVGKDIAQYFGDSNYRRSLARLDEDEKGVSQMDTPGGVQNMTVINESGLYSLMFYMQPQKAKGVSQNDTLINERISKLKKFKRWVTREVLPAIRKTGHYEAPGYAPKATSIGEVVNLIKITRQTMKEQGATPTDIAKAVKEICEQFGVNLPQCFIKPKETTMTDVMQMIDFIYAQPKGKGHKVPTYDDFIIYQASVKRLGG